MMPLQQRQLLGWLSEILGWLGFGVVRSLQVAQLQLLLIPLSQNGFCGWRSHIRLAGLLGWLVPATEYDPVPGSVLLSLALAVVDALASWEANGLAELLGWLDY